MVKDGPERPSLVAALQHELEARPEIVFAYLHGSFLAGAAYRDIDVAIWLDTSRVARGDLARGDLARGDLDGYALDLSVALHLRLKQPIDPGPPPFSAPM